MRTQAYGQNIIQLTQGPSFFPINAYLVRESDGFTLVDTGWMNNAPAVLAAAEANGAPIKRILLTHAHGDHVGSLDALHAALPDVEVMISARDARFLRGDMSLDPNEPQAKPRGSFITCTTEPTRLLSPGDRIGSLEVIAAPGHTPGHVAYLDVRDRSLIAGDALQSQGGLVVSGGFKLVFPFSWLATWHRPTALASARALRALSPSRLMVGHGPVLENPLAAMDAAIRTAERRVGAELAHVAS